MRKLILIILLVVSIQQAHACDLCGCNSGNYFIGPMPQFNRYFVGLQYSFQQYNTVLNTDKTQFSNNFFQTTNLLLGSKFLTDWQLFAFIPYNINKSHSDEGSETITGLGDITFLTDYNLLDIKTLNKDSETVFHQWMVGGGIKIPTGKFRVDSAEIVSTANMQMGTGSYDFLINSIYSYQIRSWGFNFNANYKINTSSQHFKFGNLFSINTFVFRTFHIDNLTISPNVGLLFESIDANRNYSQKVADTGGTNLFASLGLEIRLKNISLGTNFQIPLLTDISNHQTMAKTRGMCHLSIMF